MQPVLTVTRDLVNLKMLSLGFLCHSYFLALDLSRFYSERFFSFGFAFSCMWERRQFSLQIKHSFKRVNLPKQLMSSISGNQPPILSSHRQKKKKNLWRTDDQHPVALIWDRVKEVMEMQHMVSVTSYWVVSLFLSISS